METEKDYPYAYLNAENDGRMIFQKKGQVCAAGVLGILSIEDMYIPILPGNVMNGFSYNFPVQIQFVKGLKSADLFAGKEEVYDGILDACRELQKYGVRAITGACGFFGNYQARLAAELDIPVALSSLVSLPWIAAMLKPEEKIAVLTANGGSCTEKLLKSCFVPDWVIDKLIIRGMEYHPQFGKTIIENKGGFDNTKVKQEFADISASLVHEFPEIGAFLLECTEMPPYAHIVQAVTQRPVYDFISMLNWVASGLCRKPFSGWM